MPNLDLIRQLASKNSEMKRVQEQLKMVTTKLSSWQSRKEQELALLEKRQRAEFSENVASRKHIVDRILSEKRKGAEDIVDSAVAGGKSEFIGRDQMVSVVERMKEVLPEQLVEEYTCVGSKLTSDTQAYKAYAFIDSFASTNGGGTLPTRVFTGLTNLLGDVTEQQGHAGAVALTIGLLPVACLVLAPFVFPTVFVGLSIFGVLNGVISAVALRKLHDVREYMADAYDEDLFCRDKENLLKQVNDFLAAVKEQEYAKIDSVEFVLDQSTLDTCAAKYDTEKENLTTQRENLTHQIELLQGDLSGLAKQQEEEQEKAHAYAEKVREEYFTKLLWKRQWVDNLVFDITPNDTIESIPWNRCNSLYTFEDTDVLQGFTQLVAFQLMLLEHPNFARQIVLDFKYLGGKVIAMAGLNPGIIDINYGEQATTKVQSIHDDVRRRVSTILQSSPNVEEFNKLMQSYGVTGESYVVVHVCGLSSITPQWLELLRNSVKVGYFFKFYLTVPELTSIGKQINIEDFKEFWSVDEHILPRSENSLKIILSKQN